MAARHQNMAKPTVKELVSSLQHLVKWEHFGLQLPGMDHDKIQEIKKRTRDDIADAKVDLCGLWLRVHPSACWSDVVDALENVNENSIAETIKKSQKLPLIHQSSKAAGVPAEKKVRVRKDVVDELARLNDDFMSLTQDVKSEIRSQIENEMKSVADFVHHVQELRAYEVSFNSVQTTDQFFGAILPHYNFLDCHLIMRLAVFLSPSIGDKAKQYKADVEAFTQTRQIKTLHNQLNRYFKKNSRHDSKIKVSISLQNPWGKHTMWLVKTLVKELFSLEEHNDFQWFEVGFGSVLVVFLASKSMVDIYSERIRHKLLFMRMVGVIWLQIHDHNYLDLAGEFSNFSFEYGLIAATVSSNIEAVVFLLQHMNVNVNVQATSPLRTTADIKDSSYQTEFSFLFDFEMMKSLFLSLVEDVKAHTEKLEGQVQSIKVLDKLLCYSHFLSPELLTNFSQKVPSLLQKRILEYNDRILWFKKQSKITHLQEPLKQLLPDRSGIPSSTHASAKILITLQPAWCNCSVWCVELLVTSIFSFLPIKEFYWYRVSCDPLTVEFHKPLDPNHNPLLLHKIPNHQLFLSLAGVTQLWHLGETLFETVNDETYSFVKACLAAKAQHCVEAVQFLQQIIDEPLAFMYDLDDNNNYSVNIDAGATPLMVACFSDDLELVKKLLDYKADPNIENSRKRTALMYACRNAKMVELLVSKGADISISDIHGDTVLTWASFIGNVPLVKYIMKCDHDEKLLNAQRENGQTALHLASQEGHLSIIKELTKKKIDVNIQDTHGETPLYAASANGHLPVVEYLLKKQADPNFQKLTAGETSLYVASCHGYLQVVECLVRSNAKLDIRCDDGQTALHGACFGGHAMVVEYLLQKNADPCVQMLQTRVTPLLLATIEGHLSVVELLLTEKKVDPNCQDIKGLSPLWFASCLGHLQIVKRLVQEDKIDLDIRTVFNETPLQGAIRKGQTEIVEYLQKVAHGRLL